jgi:hypothetical protein
MFFKYIIQENITKRTPELEKFILENPKYSYEYCSKILKKRWKGFESSIINIDITYLGCYNKANCIKQIYLYSKKILKKRWPKGEKKILEIAENYFKEYSNYDYFPTNYIVLYAKNVIKGRWKEAENYILQTDQLGFYLSILKDEKDIKELNSSINLNAFIGKSNIFKNFKTWSPTNKIKVKGKKAFEVMILERKYQSRSMITPKSYSAENTKLVFQLSEWLNSGHHYAGEFHVNTHIVYNEKENKFYKGAKSYNKSILDCTFCCYSPNLSEN